jgi:phage-related protein
MPYQAVYYRDSDGNEPVNQAIDRLPDECQDSVDWSIGLLNSLSDARPGLPHPYSSALKGGKYRAFRELRTSCGGTHYRIIFRRSHRFLILLHFFRKDTDQVPEAEKKLALERWLDFTSRMDAPVRNPPRAMGRDAP